MPKIACLNADLDGLAHYAAIHGLSPAVLDPAGADAVARLAPLRLSELFAAASICGTFFAVGEDVPASSSAAAALRRAALAGHEIGNHTRSHPYDLVRLSPSRIQAEVEGGAAAIAEATGKRPVGFRAPGYTLSATVLRSVVESGHAYDSSVFPALPYYLGKAAVMALRGLSGRPSRAILDRPRALLAPTGPYRPAAGEPYARGRLPLWELPITVEPWTRFPFIGTFLTTLPWPAVDALWKRVRHLPFLNVELHGIDVMDASDGVGPALAAAQRDLALPAGRKIERLTLLAKRLASEFEVVTLGQAAARFSAAGVL